MGNDIAISLQGVSKCFTRYEHPVDRLKEILLPTKSRAQQFWAVRDVSLEVRRGETMGLIGRNGSGKSTLLQMIAGILQPTQGRVEVNGRISALLELGSGFNPEFTGRQNVFFNGRILGLTQQEITDRFETIAAFAEIGDFMDQPVKTYSSGMFVRLAFAVAVSVDPDILIVDEALSVGDVYFQQKCFEKIRSMQSNGVTLLFVSHDPGAVYQLCSRAALMVNGEMILDSKPKAVLDLYEAKLLQSFEKSENPFKIRVGGEDDSDDVQIDIQRNSEATLKSVKFFDQSGHYMTTATIAQTIELRIVVEFHQAFLEPHIGFMLRDRMGTELYSSNTSALRQPPGAVSAGETLEVRYQFVVRLNQGEYTVTIGIANEPYGEGLFRYVLAFTHDAVALKVVRDPEATRWSGVVNLEPTVVSERRATQSVPAMDTVMGDDQPVAPVSLVK